MQESIDFVLEKEVFKFKVLKVLSQNNKSFKTDFHAV